MKKKKIHLGNQVVVSDPIYNIETSSQSVVSNVKPGIYYTWINKTKSSLIGEIITEVVATHEEFYHELCDDCGILDWHLYDDCIEVNSGQCGIFSIETYRNDKMADIITRSAHGQIFEHLPIVESGDLWYMTISSLSLSKKGWGTYWGGVVATAGIGCGEFDLFIQKENDEIHSFLLEFADPFLM